MPELTFDPDRLAAIIFDLDGTLYRQDALRAAMFRRLVRGHALRPWSGWRTMRVLSAYRKAQEHLRESASAAPPSANLAKAQIELTCQRTGASSTFVQQCVTRWMEQAPLDLVARHIQPGLRSFLTACNRRGWRLGVLSDYPADAKLKSLGLDEFFDVVLTAQSPEVGVFKPHPRGLLLAAEQLQASPSACLYVGDRAEVDGQAAAAAGMPSVILTGRPPTAGQGPWTHVTGFPELSEMLLRPTTATVAQPGLNVG